MGTWVLLAATPIFGFALDISDATPTGPDAVLIAQLSSEQSATADGSVHEEENDRIREALEERNRLQPWHIIFGNLAWGATTITTLLGFLTYHDRYGFGGPENDTPCARGDPIMSTDFCDGTPWPHALAATALTLFYASAFTTALLMPDPLDVGEGDGAYAQQITFHRGLRWVVLGLIIGQAVLGGIAANIDSDFETRRTLAGIHLSVGVATWLTMALQGILGSMLAY